MKKEQIQETIQKLFERACRSYAFNIESYDLILVQIERIEGEIETLYERKEIMEKASELSELLNSENITKLKEMLGFKSIDNLNKDISAFLKTSDDKFEEIERLLGELEKEQEQIVRLRIDYNKMLKCIWTRIRYIISFVADNGMKLVVKEDIADVAYKAFVNYYQYSNNFNSHRNIIDIENSTLPEKFVDAYLEQEETDQALEWFEKEAKKIKF